MLATWRGLSCLKYEGWRRQTRAAEQGMTEEVDGTGVLGLYGTGVLGLYGAIIILSLHSRQE